jgi:hypothetical protein
MKLLVLSKSKSEGRTQPLALRPSFTKTVLPYGTLDKCSVSSVLVQIVPGGANRQLDDQLAAGEDVTNRLLAFVNRLKQATKRYMDRVTFLEC